MRASILLFLLLILLHLFATRAEALDVLIYHGNYAYTDSKTGLEGKGYTVTGSTSTTVAAASTLANYDVVFDQLYNNNCGSTCRANYDTYVKDGGTLVIVGENSSFSTRNNTVISLIENKFGGTLDLGADVYGGEYYSGGTNNTVNTSISGADDGGQYITGSEIASTSDGTWVAKTSGGAIIWMMWRGSSLPSGYTGSVIVTFDINQFQASYDSNATWEFFDDVVYYGINGSIQSSGPTTSTSTGTSGGITSAQSTSRSSARTRSDSFSDNSVYIDQVGDNNTVVIEQDGNATNTIRGIYSTGDDKGLIQGNSNTIEMRQGADTSTASNLIEFKIIGSSNDVLLYQDRLNTGYEDTQAGGGHTIILDLNGSSNDIDIIQRNNYSTNGGHFVDLEVVGSSNGIDLKQISDYSKDIFGKVTGSNNSVTVYQHEDSNKYLDFDLTGNGHTLDVEQKGTGAHNAEITLINGSAPSTVNLLQQGTLDQSYSLEQTCYTLGGCSVDVTQGSP